jgi:hypothetical protein
MNQQLIYTSATRGLQPGKSGFCVVASSQGLAPNLGKQLEALSGYRHIFSPGDPKNPTMVAHRKIRVGGRPYHVLSRVADAGLDPVGRSNMLAHHIALDTAELPAGGPAWLLAPEHNLMAALWDKDPQILPPLKLPQGQDLPTICSNWQEVTGDAGWGGVPAQAIADKSKKPVAFIYGPETNLQCLLQESLRLLPEASRWEVTFSTFFTKPQPGMACHWRGFFTGTAEADIARRDPRNIVIDLTARLECAPDSRYVEAAREGKSLAEECLR